MRTLAIATALLSTIGAARAQAPQITDPTDEQILEAFLGHVDKSARYCTPQRMARFAAQPEDITWQGSLYIRLPLVAYRLTDDAKYLDMFVERMDVLCNCLSKGPDGFLGWVGLPLKLFRHPQHPNRKADVMLTSFVVAGLMADFARAVQADPTLKAKHGAAARRYLDIAQNHLVRKWDARGCYQDLGDAGAVYITHPSLKPVKARLTQPHNKHSKIIRALVALYAATANDVYLVKAIKLGTRFKRCLMLKGNRYVWNYWDPAGAWDVHPDQPARWKHWIGAEHRGGYYSLSLSQAVFLYEHGLVFTRADIERFLRTQTTVCWNADTAQPRWARVDGKPSKQGYLCSALAPFDPRIHTMAFGPPAQRARLKGRTHSWQGSVIACGWLEFKHLTYPKWRSGKPAETAVVAPFRAKPENQALLKRLAFEVKGSGYKPPLRPADMKPMPQEHTMNKNPQTPTSAWKVIGQETHDGVLHCRVQSAHQRTPTLVRILVPPKLAPPEQRRVLFVLPVEAGREHRYGDGLATVRALKAHERFGFVVVTPTFADLPWYCDHPTDAGLRQEAYMLQVVVPLVAKLHPHKPRHRALLGFSKSGWGAYSLLLRHPERFGAAAAWDAPMMMASPSFGMAGIVGTQANFDRYRIPLLLEAHADAVRGAQRLALLGYGNFRDHHRQCHALMERLGIPHAYTDGPPRKHHWNGGWVDEAVTLLDGMLR